MEREGEHNWLPLMQDELTAWLPQSHPMAELRAFPVAAFASEPCIETYPGRDIDNARVFARCGITPNLKFSTMDSLATYSMVEAGLGVSMNNAINGRAWSGKVPHSAARSAADGRVWHCVPAGSCTCRGEVSYVFEGADGGVSGGWDEA